MSRFTVILRSAGSAEVVKAFDRVGKGATRASKRLGTLRRAFGRMSLVARFLSREITALTSAFGGILLVRKVITTFVKFEETMLRVRAVAIRTTSALEVQTAQMQLLEQTARRLGATTRFTATQAAEGLLLLSRAGFAVSESTAALSGVLNLALAGQLDLAEAADITATAIRSYGLEAEQASRVTDTFVTVTNRSNTDIQQLGEVMKFVGPVAASLGLSLEETAAAAGALGNAGIKASKAGTGLRGIIASLLGPTPKARRAIERLGLTVEELNPQANSLVDIFQKLADANLKAGDATDIFRRRQFAAALALTKNVKNLRDLTEEANKAAGSSEEFAKIVGTSTFDALRRLVSAFEEFGIATGESAIGLKSVIEGAAQLVRAFAGTEVALKGVSREALIVRDVLMTILEVFVLIIGTKIVLFLGRLAVAIFTVGSTAKKAGIFLLATVFIGIATALKGMAREANLASGAVQNLADASSAVNLARAGENFLDEIKALRDQQRAASILIEEIQERRKGSLFAAVTPGDDPFRNLEGAAADGGPIGFISRELLSLTGGAIKPLEDAIAEAEKRISELQGQALVARKLADEAKEAQSVVIRELIQSFDIGTAVDRFGLKEVAEALGPSSSTKDLIDKFNRDFFKDVETAFSESTQSLRDSLKVSATEGRDAVRSAIEKIFEVQREADVTKPKGLIRIEKAVDDQLDRILDILVDRGVEIGAEIAKLNKQLDNLSRSKLGSGRVSGRENRIKALQDQAKAVGDLRGAIEGGLSTQLVFEEQQKIQKTTVKELTNGIIDQTNKIGLSDIELMEYNLAQQLFNKLVAIGALETGLLENGLGDIEIALAAFELKQFGQNVKDSLESVEKMTEGLRFQQRQLGFSGTALEEFNSIERVRQELMESGALSTDKGKEALRQFTAEARRLRVLKEIKSILDEIGSKLADAFVDVITGAKSANEALEDLFKTVSKAILSKAISALITGGVGAAFGGSFEKGGIFSGNRVVPFGDGGIIDRPSLFPLPQGRIGLAGESGPEAVVPLKRTSDGSLGISAEGVGGGGDTFIFNIQTPDANSFRRSLPQIERAVKRRLNRR